MRRMFGVQCSVFDVVLLFGSGIRTLFLMAVLGAISVHSQEKLSDHQQPRGIPIAQVKRSTPVDFESEILPLLKSHCLACHNKTTAKAGLVLETPADIL